MKETGKVFGVLQRVGRAFMLPIAVLPVAGLLLGIGRSLTNETMLRAYHLMKIMGPGTILYGVIKVGSDCGSIIFGNLPLIFAMGVSIGMAKAEKAVAATKPPPSVSPEVTPEAAAISSVRKELQTQFQAIQKDIRESGGIDNVTPAQAAELKRVNAAMAVIDQRAAEMAAVTKATLSEQRRLADQEDARKKALGR